MGRKIKRGLDYFPLDVDFWQDEKFQFVEAKFGIKGSYIAIRLLCKIYRDGYYTHWNDDIALLFASRDIGNVTANLVSDVVEELVRRGFFDETILGSFDVLTSGAIQARFLSAVSERKEVEIDMRYWLIDVPEDTKTTRFVVSRPENNINRPGNNKNLPPNPQSKVKESKENNIKEKAAFGEFGNVRMLQEEYDKLIEKYPSSLVEGKIDALDSNIQEKIPKYLKYKDHYLTINKWCKKDAPVEEIPPSMELLPDTNKTKITEGMTWSQLVDMVTQ